MAEAKAKSNDLFNARERRAARMEATEGTQLSDNAYNLTLGVTLVIGLAITAVLTSTMAPVLLSINLHPGILLLIWLALVIGSSVVISKSKTPAVSAVGFFVLSASMGAVLSFVTVRYSVKDIQAAVLVTGMVTVAMMIVSSMFPATFKKMGAALGVALLADIVLMLVTTFIFHANLAILSWVGVVIFTLYIGYDWARAQEFPKTANNAICSAADIYVDIINLFLLILRLMDKK
jgi:FtsH-binding integral membrane protein